MAALKSILQHPSAPVDFIKSNSTTLTRLISNNTNLYPY